MRSTAQTFGCIDPLNEASFTECPLGSGTGVLWRHGDNQDAAPAHNDGAQDTTEVVLQCAGCQ